VAFYESAARNTEPKGKVSDRMVQKLERAFLSRFTIVEIEHPPKAVATFYGIIA
jgi:hypothetical protein